MTIERRFENFKLLLAKKLDFEPLPWSRQVEHKSANPGGDWVGIATALKYVVDENPGKIQLLEVGTAHGHFLRTWVDLIEQQKRDVIGYGVDSKLHGYCPCQFNEKMTFVEGKSTDQNVIDSFTDEQFNFAFIDGCHCSKHAELDARNYWRKVKVGGFLGFHDSSPRFQGGSEQPRTPECAEDTHIGVVKGIEASGIKDNGFEFFLEEYHTDEKHYYGGVTIYKRVK